MENAHVPLLCSCEIIRDWKTGDSLCYAFIEFEKVSASRPCVFDWFDILRLENCPKRKQALFYRPFQIHDGTTQGVCMEVL